jgi:HEAT repeat protein
LQILGDVVRRDSDLDVRIAATNELGRFPEQAAIEALGVALSERDPALQYRAVQSLKSATGHDFGNSVPAWREFVAGRTPLPERQPSLVERFRRLF